MIYIGTIGTIVLLIQHEYFIPTDLNVMWKPEEEDVEDQLRAEQTKRKFDDTRNHERSVETDRFSAIFFLLFSTSLISSKTITLPYNS